jgi:hypothetical protein
MGSVFSNQDTQGPNQNIQQIPRPGSATSPATSPTTGQSTSQGPVQFVEAQVLKPTGNTFDNTYSDLDWTSLQKDYPRPQGSLPMYNWGLTKDAQANMARLWEGWNKP